MPDATATIGYDMAACCIGYFYGPAGDWREFGFWMAFGEQCKNVLHDVTHVTDGHTMGHEFDRIQTNHDRLSVAVCCLATKSMI